MCPVPIRSVSLLRPFPDVLRGFGTANYPTMHCIFKHVLQKFTSGYLGLKKWEEKMMESDRNVCYATRLTRRPVVHVTACWYSEEPPTQLSLTFHLQPK